MYKQAFIAILFLLEHIIIFFPTLRVTNKLQLNKHDTQVQNSGKQLYSTKSMLLTL